MQATPCPQNRNTDSLQPVHNNQSTRRRSHTDGARQTEVKEVQPLTKSPATSSHNTDVERWDDAYEFGTSQSFEQVLDQLHGHFPRSPLSDNSDQSDYFQQASPQPLFKGSNTAKSRRASYSSYTHALPSPPTTTTATTLMSSRGTQCLINERGSGSQGAMKRLVGSTDSLLKLDPRSSSTQRADIANKNNSRDNGRPNRGKGDALPPLLPPFASFIASVGHEKAAGETDTFVRDTGRDGVEKYSAASTPTSSTSSSDLRAITASVTAPSTVALSTGSRLHKEKDDDELVLSTKPMTTITQEMMLSNLPTYTGIITRINPIKRVEAWVDDLEDLEVPEEDLDFNQVRSILAKSSSSPETLESVDNWDTSSENSAARSDDLSNAESSLRMAPSHSAPIQLHSTRSPVPVAGIYRPGDRSIMESVNAGTCVVQGSETIETLDEDFDLPEDLESLRIRLQARHHQQQRHADSKGNSSSDKNGSLQQWQDSGSETDDLDFGTPMDNHSLSSAASLSRNSMVDDEDFLDGLVIPENLESLKLVTSRPHRSETEPSIFGRESRFQEEQDDFWEGLEVGDDNVFHRKSRNRNLVIRAVPHGRERSGSRVQRVVVPLKDFEALPSKIPRLSRAPGDNTRPVTTAPSLSRTHSTHLELPLRGLQSKSSLPRLKRPSIVRRDGAKSSLLLQAADIATESNKVNGSQPPSPTSLQLTESKRNSLLNNKGDIPNLRLSSHAIRAVTFTEPTDTTQPGASASQIPTSEQPLSPSTGKSFPGLRTLARKFDFTRPRFSARGLIPLFQPTFAAEQNPKPSEAPRPIELISTVGPGSGTRSSLLRPSYSRSSSFTELGTIVASTETTKESLSSSRAGLVTLADISEVPTTALGQSMTPVSSADKFSRRLILKRSPKHSTFGDGSELDQFDNLPTFGVQVAYEEDRLRATQAVAQARKQSTDRVAVWLRKPQSVANFKDLQKAEAKESESEVSSSSRIRKTKSIRKSIFDIFGQSTTSEQPVKKQEKQEKKQKKKKANSSGPTLIRDLSQSRVRNVSGMVYNPQDKMWNGNDDILDEFEEDENATSPLNLPSPLSSHSYSLHSPLMSASRPALISNMNQCLGQRTQVSGKMIFDPVKMCWMVNPEYISRRRQRRKDEHPRQGFVDEAWGDEPDVFAGLSDCEKDQDEDDKDSNQGGDGDRTTGSNSLSRSRGQRLLSRPSFQRTASQELLAEEERLQAWAETMKPRTSYEAGDSRPGSMGPHSIIPKASRKSLNGLNHGGCWSGFSGGGYSSRGDFEVGVEFDITDAFLEQCINVEAQHRKEAGRFFALPCTQAAQDVHAPKTSRLSRMASSKVLSLGRKSGKSKRPIDDHVEGLEQHVDNEQGKQNTKEHVRKGIVEMWKGKEESKKDKGKEKQKATEEASANGEVEEIKKARGMSFPINPLRSWPPRNKSKSKSVAQLLISDGPEVESRSTEGSTKPKPSALTSKESGMDGSGIGSTSTSNHGRNTNNISSDSNRNKGRSKTISKAGLFPFTSSYSTSSAAPAAVTLAARGRGGSRDVSFHQLPSKHDSIRGTLSFAATLAVARRGTYDRRRIGDNTFDPLSHSRSTDGEPALCKDKEDKLFNSGKEIDDDDNFERGYRVTSKARGRPPMRPREELILEFERHAGRRFR